mgnify:CR=1 FL=1
MKSKVMSLTDAVQLVKDGQLLAIGGNSLHRNPAAFCNELAKLKRKGLKACGAAHGYATDVLCAVESIDEVYFGFFGFENEFGLAAGFRKKAQEGKIKAMEGSCTAQIAALRGGAYGVPFMPVGGMWGSDLLQLRPEFYRVMKSPFSDEEVVCVRSLRPDWAIIHVQEADEFGNARIIGPEYQDVLMSRAAKKTIITTEKIVPTETFKENPKLTSIPYFLVEAVVEVPGGAKPGICYSLYEQVDAEVMNAYLKAVKDDTLDEYLAKVTA